MLLVKGQMEILNAAPFAAAGRSAALSLAA